MISLRSFLGLAALLALPLACISQSGTDVESLSGDCLVELNQLLGRYSNPIYTYDSCDTACVQACGQTLETAIYADKSSVCPLQEDITRCFQLYAPQWEEYVTECDLFKFTTVTAEGEATPTAPAEGEGEAAAATTATTAAEAAAEAEAPSPEEGEAEAAAAPSPEEAEGEAEEVAAPAPAPAEAEDAGRRRRHLMAAEGEGEGEGGGPAGSGCFPPFDSVEEFDSYIKGTYWTTTYDSESNTAGVIMSVFFWIGLAGMGFFLRN